MKRNTKSDPAADEDKGGRPSLLSDEVEAKVCEAIRQGAFAWVAAAAAGISTTTFHRWMADGSPRFRKFREQVDQARAVARMSAEHEVKRMKPEVWLRMGPGREKPGEPGWTESHALTSADGAGLAVSVVINRGSQEESE